ncbi:hypothetical protein HYT26_00585 [Candidatus Pacearchaeota archaeon]|nr:hypothetical protein [Candidatus Pacearchaeota archaeon]
MFSLSKIFRDKNAGEKTLSIWWFFILALIGVTIVASVVMYYSADVDVKEIEAGILAGKVAGCIIQNGYLDNEFIKTGSNFDIYKNCNIDESVIKNNNNFYIGISVYDFSSCKDNECASEIKKLSFSAGAGTIPEDCKTKEAEEKKGGKAEHFPRCSEKSFIVFNRHDNAIPEKLVLKILAGSNQKGRIEL